MTAQAPEKLTNEHARVDLGSMNLYRVIRGDVSQNHGWGIPYEFEHLSSPPKDARRGSFLWRGYIANFRLTAKGCLILCGYSYPVAESKKEERFEEVLHGNFWMVMKHNFFGPRTYIPIYDGRIVESEADWIREPPRSKLGGSPRDVT